MLSKDPYWSIMIYYINYSYYMYIGLSCRENKRWRLNLSTACTSTTIAAEPLILRSWGQNFRDLIEQTIVQIWDDRRFYVFLKIGHVFESRSRPSEYF